jgi:flavin reductase (DIM6/NTAB) family NADH-FMN oxidoreductase RutF
VSAEAPGTRPALELPLFRAVMGSLAGGVTVVTTLGAREAPFGLTCSAVCSVSLEPPLLLVSLNNHSDTLAGIRGHGSFALNLLAAQDQPIAQLFASDSARKFQHVAWSPGEATGCPLLMDTVARAECDVQQTIPAGDHTLLIARPLTAATTPDLRPLTYWRGSYTTLLP